MSRGPEFLFSQNRLNVAIGRARCLAYLVCTADLFNSKGHHRGKCDSSERCAHSCSRRKRESLPCGSRVSASTAEAIQSDRDCDIHDQRHVI
jgi:hypothetical protein